LLSLVSFAHVAFFYFVLIMMQYDTISRIESEALPQKLNNKDVLVKMIASPINPGDLSAVYGGHPTKSKLPAVGGNEGVGTVLAVGSGVSNVKTNDTVVIGKSGLGECKKKARATHLLTCPLSSM
jgi:NADPH:quinone reductase-like Zn-dependent oxidoreductase